MEYFRFKMNWIVTFEFSLKIARNYNFSFVNFIGNTYWKSHQIGPFKGSQEKYKNQFKTIRLSQKFLTQHVKILRNLFPDFHKQNLLTNFEKSLSLKKGHTSLLEVKLRFSIQISRFTLISLDMFSSFISKNFSENDKGCQICVFVTTPFLISTNIISIQSLRFTQKLSTTQLQGLWRILAFCYRMSRT